MTTTAPSLERYRTQHVITPELAPSGWQVCGHCGIRVYTVMGRRWRHDQGEILRLIRRENRRALYEPCFFCGSVDLIVDGLYSAVTLGTGVVNLCDNCKAKGEESDEARDDLDEGEATFDREGQPEFNGAFR